MIAVCGPHEADQDERRLAEAVGRLLAEAGETLVCGGRGGVMAAASRGAKLAGGTTIGILPGYDPAAANEWTDHPIPTGLGEARNAVVVASGAAVIAIGGGFGTLSEIALALKLGKRVVTLGGWTLDPQRVTRLSRGGAALLVARDPAEAVRLALGAARQPGHG
ncbi:MAG TPA: TIGR00725 family protein [Thermomicrobiaceae bacterium]|nr:TIGR00725 family protein [Thermomicrobiaceae bacterium]